jgi:ubiquinone/menaquinone biosynthesis C-methylase UbiE
MKDSRWWRGYFDDVYFSLHDPLFPESESRHEVGAMRELLGLPVGARILDVPCGWGRHTRLFASSGYEAFGADLSPSLLKRARRGRRSRSALPRYAAAELRALPFADGVFDAVINVFTSLGLFQNDRDDVRALREARRVLAPGGRFLMETMHRDEVVCAYAESDEWTLPDGTHVAVRRRFDPVTGVSHETLRWTRGRRNGEKTHALKLRTATEVAALLRKAGFREVAYYGGWEGEPFERDSERLIAVTG